jgi:hypothetical protein
VAFEQRAFGMLQNSDNAASNKILSDKLHSNTRRRKPRKVFDLALPLFEFLHFSGIFFPSFKTKLFLSFFALFATRANR